MARRVTSTNFWCQLQPIANLAVMREFTTLQALPDAEQVETSGMDNRFLTIISVCFGIFPSVNST